MGHESNLTRTWTKFEVTVKGGGSPQLYYHDCSGEIPELETNSFQSYAIANLEKTSLLQLGQDRDIPWHC